MSRLRMKVPTLPTAVATGAVVLLVGAALNTAWVGDDCAITWRTVLNLLDGHGLRWNIDERVQTHTHPLWMLSLVTLRGLGLDLYFASIGFSLALLATLGTLVARRPGHELSAAFVLLLLAASRPFVDYSTSGLENPLTHLLLSALLLLTLRPACPRPADEPVVLPVLLTALLALNRLDSLALAAPILLAQLVRAQAHRRIGAVVLPSAPLLAWLLFALVYTGDPLPNTAHAKLNFVVDPAVVRATGLAYLRAAGELDPVTLPLLGAGLVAGAWFGTWRHRAAAAGALASLAYVVAIGGDFMIGRFITPALLVAALLLEDVLHAMPRRAALAIVALALPLPWATPTSPLRTGTDYRVLPGKAWDDSPYGFSDERAFYFSNFGLRRPEGAWTSPLARRSDADTADVLLVGGAGLGPAAAPAALHVVDDFALVDPFLARLPASESAGFRPGHLVRPVPAGYLESLERRRNLVIDARLAALLDDVFLATRAPLLEPGRPAAILRLLLRQHVLPPPAPPADPPYPAADWPMLLPP